METYRKPLPYPDPDTAPFWEAAKQHELRIPRCADCGAFRWPPRHGCPTCASRNTDWPRVDGTGEVYTYTVVRRGVLPGFRDSPPYAVVVVELPNAGSVRLLGNVIDVPVDEVRIGMPVEVVFDDVTPETTLPRFRRRDGE